MLDKQELERLYRLHFRTVWNICLSFLQNPSDTEDAVQETFLRLVREDLSFQSDAHGKAWLIHTAKNICRDELRRHRRQELPLEEARNASSDVAAGGKLLLQNGNRGMFLPGSSGTEAMLESTTQESASPNTTVLEAAETQIEETAQQAEVKSDAYFLEQTEALLNRAGFLHVEHDAFELRVLSASGERDWDEVEVHWQSKTGPVILRYAQKTGILLGLSGMNLVECFDDQIDPLQRALDFYASLTPEQSKVDYTYSQEENSDEYDNDYYLIRFSPDFSSDSEDCLELTITSDSSCVGILTSMPKPDDQYFHQRALDILKQAGYTDLDQTSFTVKYDAGYNASGSEGLHRDRAEVYFEGRGWVYLDYETGSLLQMPGFEWTVSGNGPCASQEEADALVTQFYESLPVPQGYCIAYCGQDERRPDWLNYWFRQKITADGLPDEVYGRGEVTILLNPSTGDMQFKGAEDFPIDPIPIDETPLTKAEAWEIIRDNLTPEQYDLFEKADLETCSYSPFTLKDINPQNSSYKVTRLYWQASYDIDVHDSVWVDCYTGEFYHLHD